jgi:hypothetical protein
MAVVLLVLAVIKGEASFVSLSVYTRKDHKYPVVESNSLYVLIPNLDALRGRYCLNNRRPFQSVSDSSIEISLFGRYSS